MPGSGYDQLDISGLATLNGTLDLELLNGFSPSTGESFTLFNGRTTGSFAQIGLPTLSNGLSWNTSNLYTNGTISVTPEPSTFALLVATGGIGLIVAAWRRRRGRRCLQAATAAGEDDAPALLSFPVHPTQRTRAIRRAA